MEKHLHIVCHTVPYPANFGGVIDLFYKIRHLAALNVKIYLHCFDYGRGQSKELEKYCVEVNYYKRKNIFFGFSFFIPFIVNSRNNPTLFKRLLKDRYPIIFEGIHSTYFVYKDLLKDRKILVRLANVEYEYYYNQSLAEKSFLKKLYLKFESKLLKKYEQGICNKTKFFTVSKNDESHYKSMGATDIFFLPVFIPFDKVSINTTKSSFCLYHGDLSVAENQKSVYFLLDIFKEIHVPFVIAGRNPPSELKKLAESNDSICIIANPLNSEMNDLIAKAQINVIPSFNNTGIKLKFLHALFNGKHCIVNSSTLLDTHFEKICHTCNSPTEFKEKILELINCEFSEKEINARKFILNEIFNNELNAMKLIEAIY